MPSLVPKYKYTHWQLYVKKVNLNCVRITVVAVKEQLLFHIHCECCSLSFPACNAHTSLLSSVSYFSSRNFIHIILNTVWFSGEIIYYKISLSFSPQILSETIFILIRIRRDFVTNEHKPSYKLPLIIVEFHLYLDFHERFSKNFPTSNSMRKTDRISDKEADWYR